MSKIGDQRPTTALLDPSSCEQCKKVVIANADPWYIAYRHNTRHARLPGLPDEVLLQIMLLLSPSALYMLRITSRTFNHLFEVEVFDGLKESYEIRWPFSPFGSSLRPHLLQPEEMNKVREILRRTIYCEGCLYFRNLTEERRKTRERLLEEFISCSGCKTFHSAGYFSYQQRLQPDESRICIGRQGYIRLCEHKNISWSDLEGMHKRSKDHFEIVCRDPAHEPWTSINGMGGRN